MADLVERARAAVTDRAELPGMSLMEHLAELRTRIIHVIVYLLIGFAVAYAFHERLYGIVQAPLDQLKIPLNFTHPTDGLNLYLKTSLVAGAILSSPFILYQVWLFISPGMYANEKRYVVPFMTTTIVLFLTGAYFGYRTLSACACSPRRCWRFTWSASPSRGSSIRNAARRKRQRQRETPSIRCASHLAGFNPPLSRSCGWPEDRSKDCGQVQRPGGVRADEAVS